MKTTAQPTSIKFYRPTSGKTGYACDAAGVWYKTQTIRLAQGFTRKYQPVRQANVPDSVMVEFDAIIRL